MVLVTGASGFLGRHLVQYLSARGISCRALYHSHPPAADTRALPGIEWQPCDLLDIYAVEEAMNGITDVYHCAGIVSFDARRRAEMLHFNPESTANIVNEAMRQGIRKMVYVSSVAALGRSGIAGKEITEEEEWGESRYNSAYGISKYMAEMEVWRGIGEGLNAVIVNPGIILGEAPRDSNLARLLKMAAREFPFYTSGITSWVDVADVVKIMAMLMDSEIHSERFIISDGNYSYREVCAMIAGALNKRPPRYKAGRFITGIVWRMNAVRGMLTGPGPALTRETASNASTKCFYNNSKLLNALPGFAYTPVRGAIDAMARSFLNSYKK